MGKTWAISLSHLLAHSHRLFGYSGLGLKFFINAKDVHVPSLLTSVVLPTISLFEERIKHKADETRDRKSALGFLRLDYTPFVSSMDN
jgi:hypothetical protein